MHIHNMFNHTLLFFTNMLHSYTAISCLDAMHTRHLPTCGMQENQADIEM